MDESREPRISPFSFDPKHYFKYLLSLVLLLSVYGVLIFFGSTTINRKHPIDTIVSIAEHISRVVPLGIIIVITIEGVIRKMLAAFEDFKQWRKSRAQWIAQRVQEASEAVQREASEAVQREASEAVQREASEAVKEASEAVQREASEAVKEASEAVKREASEAVKQEIEKQLLAIQQKYQENMNAWLERRVEAERKGEPFDEPMPTLLGVAADSTNHQKGESKAKETTR